MVISTGIVLSRSLTFAFLRDEEGGVLEDNPGDTLPHDLPMSQ